MKLIRILTASLVLAFLAIPVQAQVIFNPDFSSGTTPSGYTAVTTNSGTLAAGTISYSGGQMVVGDGSVNGSLAYLTASTTSGLTSNSFNTQFTFTPNFTANSGISTAADFPLLDLNTAGANNPILQIDFVASGYNSNDQLTFSQGISYGGQTTSGTNIVSSAGLNSLSGESLTFNIVTTISNLGPDSSNPGNTMWELENSGTVYANGTLLGTFDQISTGDAGGSYDPINNPLSLQVGLTQGILAYGGGGPGAGSAGFLNPPATVDISSLNISYAVPEPSTYALLGVGFLVLLGVQRFRRAVLVSRVK